MGGFTRLFNTYEARPDSLMDEIPTVLVKQLGHGNCAECDRGFIVMNRPWGAVQFVESEHFRSKCAHRPCISAHRSVHVASRAPQRPCVDARVLAAHAGRTCWTHTLDHTC
jgi:hypothetical protein